MLWSSRIMSARNRKVGAIQVKRFLRNGALLAVFLGAFFSASLAEARGLIRDAEIERTLKQMSAPVFQAAGLTPNSIELFIVQSNSLNALVVNVVPFKV